MKLLNEFENLIKGQGCFYLFDEDKFISNISRFKQSFTEHGININIGYSFKTNYAPKICQIAKDNDCWAEVVSSMEYQLSEKLNFNNRVILNGPLKEDDTIVMVGKNGGIIHVDTIDEFNRILELSIINNICIKIAIRLNFIDGDLPFSRFGIQDEEMIHQIISKSKQTPNINLIGFHIHYPGRSIDTFIKRCELLYEYIVKFQNAFEISYLSFGGGFYSEPDSHLNSMFKGKLPTFNDYARNMAIWMKKINAMLGNVHFFIEPGTAVVANTMDFYSRLYSYKRVDGIGIATLWGSVYNITGNSRGSNFPFEVIKTDEKAVKFETNMLVGYTCIESDIFNRSLSVKLSLSDVIVFKNVGSYSIVFKPPFILPNCPVFVRGKSGLSLLKRAENFEDIFNTYIFS